jgi:deazaflavin-dependent oxidoreductase (nitroreductase family)
MNTQVEQALRQDRVIDITTTGRKSGQPRRIEIWFHNLDGNLYITGVPNFPRGWYANMLATPEFTFHLKDSVQADLPATATPIVEEAQRRQILTGILEKISADLGDNTRDIETWVAGSPLVEVTLASD